MRPVCRTSGSALGLAVLIAALPAHAREGGPIRGGEHDGFTRIVLEIEPTTEWSLETGERAATLRFPGRKIVFSTAGTFDRIPQTRIEGVEASDASDGTEITLTLGCDCRLSTSFVGARFLAIDVADRLPVPAAAPDSLMPTEDRTAERARTVADAEGALIRQIERAATQGIVRFSDSDTLPRASVVSTGTPVGTRAAGGRSDRPLHRPRVQRPSPSALPEEPRSIADLARLEQISATTVFDRDSRAAALSAPKTPVHGACLPDRTLDVATWSGDGPFPDQLAVLRSRIVGEFDEPDPEAIRAIARLYVRFGLGTEAEAMLSAFPGTPVPDGPVLVDLARAVEGRPGPVGGPLSTHVDCPGLHGAWLALAGSVPVWRSPEGFDAAHSAFSEMPDDLRALLAPGLVRRLIDAGRVPEARMIYLTAVRPGATPDAALRLAEARLVAAEGRSAEAARTMSELARSSEAAISADALADLVRVALDAHLAIPETVATDLAAASLQYRGSDRDVQLRGLLVETLARRGDLPGALAELRRAISDIPDEAERLSALALRLVAEADPAIVGNAVYAEAALGTRDLADAALPTDPARAIIAGRLVDLGLPAPAIGIVAVGVAAGDEPARLVAARAEIARGDGAAARLALGPLASAAASELRAQAYARSGEFAEAVATLEAAGLDPTADYAWASGDWDKAAASADARRAAMARYMATRTGGEPRRANAVDPASLGPDEAFEAPLPSLDRPSLGAARRLLATGDKVGDFVEGAIGHD